MAAELGQTIGKPWDVSEDTFSGVFAQTNSFVQANSYVQASSSYDRGPATDESTVAPGQVSIRASFRVSFQLE